MVSVFTELWDAPPYGLDTVYYMTEDRRIKALFWTHHPFFGWCDPETGNWDGTTLRDALWDAIARGAGREVEMEEIFELAKRYSIPFEELLTKIADSEIYEVN